MTTLVMETTGVPAYQESSINYVSDTAGKESKNETSGNPMEQTNKFEKMAKATGMAVVEEDDVVSNQVDIEETVTKPLLSPMIQH